MRHGMPALAAALLVAGAPVAAAQTAHNFDRIDLGAGVYVFSQREPLQSPVDGNTVVIVNDADVVVVDSKVTPATAREIIAEIRRLTDKPVRYVVNTHWHGDHHYGNDAFRRAWPGVDFVAHANTRADLLVFDTDSGRLASIEQLPAAITTRRRYLETGKLADGSPLPQALREFYERQIPGLEFSRQQLAELVIVPPTLAIADSMVLHRTRDGRPRRIELHWMGRANTRGDLVVHLPDDRIVATGDILVAPVPFSFGSFLGDWIGTLGRIRALDVAVIVPGHGPVQRDWSYLDRVTRLIESTLTQVRAAVAAGKDLDSTRAAVNLSAFEREFGAGSLLNERAFRGFFVTPAVERAFREARGELR